MTRTHFLDELSISGQAQVLNEVPEFDFYKIGEIEKIEWEASSIKHEFGGATITLRLLYDDSGRRKISLKLVCVGVLICKLPALSGVFYVTELEVEDVSTFQLEGVRYKVSDYGESALEVQCWDLAIEIVE